MELPWFELQERCREREEVAGEEEERNDMSPAKRCSRSSEGGGFYDLWCEDEHDDVLTLEENIDPELVYDVMKSLADEIMCSDFPSVSDSASISDPTSDVDIQYLLGATDDELGIPPSPDAKDGVLHANVAITECLVYDLFDILRPELEDEGFLQLCNNSDFWYSVGEEDVALPNDTHCKKWLERSSNGDTYNQSSSSSSSSSSSGTEQKLMTMFEAADM